MKLIESPLREERRPRSYCSNLGLMVRIELTEHVRIGKNGGHSLFCCFSAPTELAKIIIQNVEQFSIRLKNYRLL